MIYAQNFRRSYDYRKIGLAQGGFHLMKRRIVSMEEQGQNPKKSGKEKIICDGTTTETEAPNDCRLTLVPEGSNRENEVTFSSRWAPQPLPCSVLWVWQ
jgi:hypothetical protein